MADVENITDDEKMTGDDEEETDVLPTNPIERRDEKLLSWRVQ